jgi:hypothetical protein
MKVNFTHGSPNLFEKHRYYDVHIKSDGDVVDMRTGKPTGGNGIDASGMGIYGVRGHNPKDVGAYSGSNGVVYLMSAEISTFANKAPADSVSAEEWCAVCDRCADIVDEKAGISLDDIIEKAESVEFGSDSDLSEFIKYITDKNIDKSCLDSFDDYDSIEHWVDAVRDAVEMHRPSSNIREELMYIDFDDMVNDEDKSAWDVMTKLSNIMFENSNGRKYYNESFYQAYKEVVGFNENLVAAEVKKEGGPSIVVFFDLDVIKVERVIDLAKRNERKSLQYAELTP